MITERESKPKYKESNMGIIDLIFGSIAFFVLLGVARKIRKRKKLNPLEGIRKPNEMGAHGVYGE